MIRSSHGGTAAGPGAARPSAKRGALPKAAPKPAARARDDEPRSLRGSGPRSRQPADAKKLKGPARSRSDGPVPSTSLGSSAARVPAGVSSASDEAREIAVLVAIAAIEKKASGLEVIDVAGRVDYADFLVLMSGRSDRHVTALSSAIEEALRKRNKRALAVEGLPHASWVLMDFGDVVVHVFQDDARAAYDIDGLWMDARRVPVPLEGPRV
jgi:ribosome-associated protein